MPEPTDLLTVESHAGLVGDAVGGEAELLQLRQELRHLHRVPVLVVDLSIQIIINNMLYLLYPSSNVL